ncbi:MAG: IucA/IucC family protein [Byssovorax sp.]
MDRTEWVSNVARHSGMIGGLIEREGEFDPSASAFLNAFLREWTGWRVLANEAPHDRAGTRARHVIEIPLLSRGGALRVRAHRLSRTGRHRLVSPVHHRTRDGASREISFRELVPLLVNDVDIAGAIAPDQAQRFITRVLASARNIEAILDARAEDIEHLFSAPLDFLEAEQGLLTGHSVHPTPKSRDEFTDADARRYAPELGQGFQLRWYAVRRQCLLVGSVDPALAETRIHDLLAADPSLTAELRLRVPEGYAVLPAHPWQAARWAATPSAQRALERGDLLDLGQAGALWSATSSLRTLYAPHAPWMLKFSTSVRLTNSLRTLRIPELERGLLLCAVLRTSLGGEYQRRYPRFRVLAEPMYLGLRAEDGAPMEDTIVAFRENPFLRGGDADVYVLATLLQDHPTRGTSRLAHHIATLAEVEQRAAAEVALAWFSSFLGVVLEPIFIAQADYGVLVSAHQQNLVVRLENGYPDFVWFRDCQGTAYSDLATQLFDGEVAGLDASVFQGDRAYFLFSYSVVINTVFNVIASLVIDDVGDEASLVDALRGFLLELRARPLRDPGCLDYLLHSPRLWSKGNFFCCLRELNETTLADPMDIYHAIENPLYPTTPGVAAST